MAGAGFFGWTETLKWWSSRLSGAVWDYFTACPEEAKDKDKEVILLPLTELYGEAGKIVARQAMFVLQYEYSNNVDKFLKQFLNPAVDILQKLKKAECRRLEDLQDSYELQKNAFRLQQVQHPDFAESTALQNDPTVNELDAELCDKTRAFELEIWNNWQKEKESLKFETGQLNAECQYLSSLINEGTKETWSCSRIQICACDKINRRSAEAVSSKCVSRGQQCLNFDSTENIKHKLGCTYVKSNGDNWNGNSPEKLNKLSKNWPLVFHSKVLVNISDSYLNLVEPGDFCFCIKGRDKGIVELCVKYFDGCKSHETVIYESQFGNIFTMEFLENICLDTSDGLVEALGRCLTALEDSTEKLRWQDMVPFTGPFNHTNARLKLGSTNPDGSLKLGSSAGKSKHYMVLGENCPKCDRLLAERSSKNCRHGNNVSNESQSQNELRSRSMEYTDGREIDKPPSSPRRQGLHQHRHLEQPKTILDVDYNLLQSGVAILPGCRDVNGNAVVLIFTSSFLWKNQMINSTDLARLLMYYLSVPRETVRCRGLTIVADIRGSTTSTINTLLEALYLFEGNIPQAIAVVHLLTDKHTQSLVLKSPIYDVHASFQIDLLLSPSLLCSYISTDQLPPVLDGTFQYNHDDWIRFHMRLDPFLASCRSVARYIINIIQELSIIDQVPVSAEEASHLVNHHENLLQSTFEDARVKRLQNEGDAMLQALKREAVNIGHTDDYRHGMEDITRLYRHVQDTIGRLMRLSDTRITRLEKCYRLKDFDEECNKVISWLHTQGNECLQRHLVMADNLKAIRSQHKDFEKFYFSAMSHIEKGNDLLEEASTLAQSGDFDEVTGYKELARMLKRHLQQFSERLEETRERIEGTSKCYQYLDKTYEWALEAMKYVASMKMEHCATPEGLEKLLHSLELYLQEHPPIADDMFTSMVDIAKGLGNDKLLEQCQTAQNRCIETQKMLTLRGNTLQQFREQLEKEASAGKAKSSSALSANYRGSSDTCKYSSYSAVPQIVKTVSNNAQGANAKSHWDPKDSSTPVVPKTYSRMIMEKLKRSTGSSSPSSSPGSSPSHSAISPCSPSNSSISPSLSAESSPSHIVQNQTYQKSGYVDQNSDKTFGASVNKCVIDSTKENWREPLQKDFLSLNAEDVSGSSSMYHRGGSLNASKAKTNLLRRAMSSPQTQTSEEQQGAITESERVLSLRQDGRTDSMITGSSDSLPSLPEEEEEISAVAAEVTEYVRKEWTPVPVNTHLTEQACNTPLRPLADLKLTEEEIKSRRTLSLIMSEMVQTERDYVCSLRYIVENYIPEMEREDVPQALRGKRNIVFGNIEKIYQFHQQYFLQEMEASKRNPFLIARYFLMHENQFHLYALYNKNKPKSDSLMAEYGKTFFREKQLELNDKMDLASYLLKPVQRMGKYALLIKQVIKECPRTAPEFHDLRAAEEMVRFQLRHGNDLLAMDTLKECDVNLQEQGRLLRQDEFLVYHGRRKCMRHVFLFEDLILFSKTRRSRAGFQDTYLYKFSFKMSDIGLTQDYEGSGYKFEIWWRRRSSGESYVLQAPTSEVKKYWVKEMTKLLWNQAIKNRENRLSELATMGIGNKPCLDIKPSSDNINDRFINIAVGNKEARTRNSIAVCSNELLRQGNKRPHSIISISSNSSSNSSQGGFGTLGLGLNPVDSPRNNRRSLTFMSTESGIGTSIASGGDLDATLKFDASDLNRAQSPPPYADFQRPHSGHDREFGRQRVINLPVHAEEMTDV